MVALPASTARSAVPTPTLLRPSQLAYAPVDAPSAAPIIKPNCAFLVKSNIKSLLCFFILLTSK